MTVNVIGQRMNFLVIIHGCWLVAILVRRRRAEMAKIWPRYCLFLSIFMIYQYLLCMGIPPALCIGESCCAVQLDDDWRILQISKTSYRKDSCLLACSCAHVFLSCRLPVALEHSCGDELGSH